MKLFKKLMAGAMAIAMLSAYTMAFATSTISGTVSGGKSSEVTLTGNYGGSSAVFLMKMPTSAANAALSFTVDPNEAIHNSPPDNAISSSPYGTVIFSVKSGSTPPNVIYSNTSTPLQVISMSSVDVTVNMIATVTDTKMKLSTTSGFTGADATNHLYLGVQLATLSGGVSTPVVSGGLQVVNDMVATAATELKTVSSNFKSVVSGGTVTTLVSGSTSAAGNATAASRITDDKWTGVEYTVIGYANPDADWQIQSLAAPSLKIKWVVDAANDITYELPTPTGTGYTAKLDKAKYKAGEEVNIYFKMASSEEKPTAITLNYINVDTTTGKMKSETTARVTIESTPVNGVYRAHFSLPTDLAKDGAPAGEDITDYSDPTWEIEVG